MKHRVDKEFQVGASVYVKLQHYRQTSVANRASNKLARHYYGHFKILERLGSIAYKVELPPASKIHNVLHVSLLRLCKGHVTEQNVPLPPLALQSQPIDEPE